MSSPTKRTLEKLRKNGWIPAIVEKFNSFDQKRHDLFGFIDILAIKDNETLGIQATSYGHGAKRKNKILENKIYPKVKQANWRVEVWEWKKVKKLSKENKIYYRYQAKITVL